MKKDLSPCIRFQSLQFFPTSKSEERYFHGTPLPKFSLSSEVVRVREMAASSSSQKTLEAGKGCRLFVGNLHLSLSEGDFIKIFVKCGKYPRNRTNP